MHQLVRLMAEVRSDLASSPLVVLGVLAAMGVLGLLTLAGSRAAAVLLLPAAVMWPVVNSRVEGPTLLALSWNHGVSVADGLSVVALLLVLWRLTPPAVAALQR